MPNWCENILIVEGNTERVEEFIKFADNSKVEDRQFIDFEKFIPYPPEESRKEYLNWLRQEMRGLKEEELEKVKVEHKVTNEVLKEMMLLCLEDENKDILGWHTRNWGTKWNATHFDENIHRVDKDGRYAVMYIFDTAWSPPIPVLLAMATKFNDLIFTFLYGEMGSNFCGYIRIQDNNVLDEGHFNHYRNNWRYPKMKMRQWKLDKLL